MTTAPLRALIAGTMWIALVLWLLTGPAPTLLQAAVAGVLAAVPVWLTGAALSAIRAAHAAAEFVEPGRRTLPRIFHFARILVAVPLAGLAGAGLVLWVLTDPSAPLVALAVVVVTWAAGMVADRLRGCVRRPFTRPKEALLWSMVIGTVVASLVLLGSSPQPTDSLAAGVAAGPRYEGSSVLLGQAVDWIAVSGAAGDWALGRIGLPSWILSLGRVASVIALASAAAAFLLPGPALARILAPTDAERPVPPLLGIALASALALILPLGTIQSLDYLESSALQSLRLAEADRTPSLAIATPDADPRAQALTPADPPPPRPAPSALPLPSDLRAEIEAERIGTLWCPPGTIARVEALDRALETLLDRHRDSARGATAAAFDEMRAQVPGFLDWYYSLSAEYLRTAHLLIGDGADYLTGELSARIGSAEATRALAAAQVALSTAAAEVNARQDERRGLLAGCSDLPSDFAVLETGTRPPDFALAPSAGDWIPAELRLGGSAGAGAVAGVVMAKVVAKAGLSRTFRTAAAVLVKVAGSRALSHGGGVLAGAAGGGAVGSVIPGAGTTVGAVLGGLVGAVAVMVGVDWTLLRLEEELSREAFAAELLASIDAAEAEVLAELGLSGAP